MPAIFLSFCQHFRLSSQQLADFFAAVYVKADAYSGSANSGSANANTNTMEMRPSVRALLLHCLPMLNPEGNTYAYTIYVLIANR